MDILKPISCLIDDGYKHINGTYSVFEINIRRRSVNRGWYEIHAVTDTNAFLVIQKQLQPKTSCSCSQIFEVGQAVIEVGRDWYDWF